MNKFLTFTLVLGAMLLTPKAFALSTADTNKVADVLNQNPPGYEISLGTEITRRKVHIARGNYSWAVQGGSTLMVVTGSTVSTINLLDGEGKPVVLPNHAIVTNVLVDVQTALQSSGSATIAISLESAGDMKVATAVASYSVGVKAGTPVNTAATAIKLTADRTLTMSVGTVWLYAGKMSVLVEYYLSE